MQKPTYIRVFKNKNALNQMLTLRKKGWTYHSLALIYGVDHTSIYHECKKFGIEPPKKKINFNVRGILVELGIQVKRPKTYNDYLREAGYKPQEYFLGNLI